MLKWVLGLPYALRSMYRAFRGKWFLERRLHVKYRGYTTLEGAHLGWGVDGWAFKQVAPGQTGPGGTSLPVYDLHQTPGFTCWPEEADPHHWN